LDLPAGEALDAELQPQPPAMASSGSPNIKKISNKRKTKPVFLRILNDSLNCSQFKCLSILNHILLTFNCRNLPQSGTYMSIEKSVFETENYLAHWVQ